LVRNSFLFFVVIVVVVVVIVVVVVAGTVAEVRTNKFKADALRHR
jgi:hypothetical protein